MSPSGANNKWLRRGAGGDLGGLPLPPPFSVRWLSRWVPIV
jgi:hypothetical protein